MAVCLLIRPLAVIELNGIFFLTHLCFSSEFNIVLVNMLHEKLTLPHKALEPEMDQMDFQALETFFPFPLFLWQFLFWG